MTEQLIIVGAGGFARETARAVDALNAAAPTWALLGYVDDDPGLAGTAVSGLPVLGPVDSVRDRDAKVVVCTGRPDNYLSRRQIVEHLDMRPERFATIVHPRCSLAGDTVIGPGSVLLAGVVATAAVRVGSHVMMMPNCTLTHGDRIRDYATLASGVNLGGNVDVGTGAYVGAGALVRESTMIGAWSLIGMGSVVLRPIGAKEVWAGVPARMLRAADVPDSW